MSLRVLQYVRVIESVLSPLAADVKADVVKELYCKYHPQGQREMTLLETRRAAWQEDE
jgi:hypothetical protein